MSNVHQTMSEIYQTGGYIAPEIPVRSEKENLFQVGSRVVVVVVVVVVLEA